MDKFRSRVFVSLLVGAMLTSCTGEQGRTRGGTVSETVLANGLRVIVKEDHRAPVVVSQIWYRVGAIDEPKGKTGISHVLEHMMFKGTTTLGPGEFSKIISENGGRENAFTGQDYTAYFQQLEKSRLPISFKLESDRMQNLVFKQEEFEKEVKVVMEERRLRTEDKPESLTYERFMSTAYKVHPYKDPIIGWMEDLAGIAVDDLRKWYQTYYSPSNAVLVVAGDVHPKDVFSAAEEYFGKAKSRAVERSVIPSEPVQTEPREVKVEAPAEVPYLLLGYHVPALSGAASDRESYALTVLSGILDGGSSARFSRNLVRGKQVAASAGAGYSDMSRGPGMFLFDGTPAKGHTISDLESAINEQIELIKKEPVTKEELARVKAQLVSSDVYGRDSVFYQAMRIGRLVTVGLDHRLLDSYIDNLKAVTAEQVQEVAKKYFVRTNRTRAELIPLPNNNKPRKPAGGLPHG